MMTFINSTHDLMAAYEARQRPQPQTATPASRDRSTGFKPIQRKRINSSLPSVGNRNRTQQPREKSVYELHQDAMRAFKTAQAEFIKTLESVSDREMIESYLRR
jgi:hypothetical protein